MRTTTGVSGSRMTTVKHQSRSRPRSSLSILMLIVGLGSPGCDFEQQKTGRLSNAEQLRGEREYDVNPGKAAEEGHELFRTKCSSCHGPDAEGRTGIGPRLASKSFLEAATDQMLTTTIKQGRAGTTMVAWDAALSDSDLERIIAYLRSTVPHTLATLDESPLSGDVSKGGELFRSICSSCHGRSGGGYVESAGGTGIGRQAFLASVTDGYLRHVIKEGKSQTAMRGFEGNNPTALANLGKTEIDDIITYLRKEAW